MSTAALATVFSGREGEVVAFDEHVGAGTVSDAASGERWGFHCTSIGDGSRTIAVGAAVTFTVAPGPTGLEAFEITPKG